MTAIAELEKKVAELLELAESEGLQLPYPPEMIARLESTGAVVVLYTGAIVVGEADRSYEWELTEAGEILARHLKRL